MTNTAKPEGALQVAVGDIVAGKYRVERMLGQGAMGVVVAAKHEELGQKVAIKLLRPEVNANDGALERFLREARAAAKLESDHVARVFDVGTFGDNCAFMVMEHLEGSDLERYLASCGRLDVPEAVDYVLEALEALAHAHAHGMVHRDIKPSNLFLTQRVDGTRRIKMLDFGISKTESGLGASSPGSSTLTSPHAVLGSPAYMAPEQIRSSKNVDQRADIWSVGVLLYELVSGNCPFMGDTIGDTLSRVLLGAFDPLTKVRPDVPQDFEAIVRRCLESDEKKRYQNVSELAAALGPFGSARTKELPARIARVLGMDPVPVHERAIIPLDVNVVVNAAAETLAAPANSVSGGTQITSTSSGLAAETTRSSRMSIAIGVAIVGVAAAIFLVMRPGGDSPALPTGEHTSARASGTSMPAAPAASPEIIPMGTAEPSMPQALTSSAALAVPALAVPALAVPALAAPTPSASSPAPTNTTKKTSTTTTSKPSYPSGLLDGRD